MGQWWLSKPFLIIVIAGCFHLGRGAPVDGAIFLTVAAALAAAEIRGVGAARRPARAPLGRLWVAVAVVALGWLVSTWQPGTVPVAVAVALAGPPMLYLALTATPDARPSVADPTVTTSALASGTGPVAGGSSPAADAPMSEKSAVCDQECLTVRPGWWLWATVGVLICLWELAQFLQQPDAHTDSWDHPTLSVILRPLFVPGPGRAVLAIAWLAAGVALARLIREARRCTR